MSRIASSPVSIPKGVDVTISGKEVNVKGAKGNLYVVLQVDVPKELTDEQRELFEALKGKLPDARKDVGW